MTFAMNLGHQAKKEMAKLDRSLACRLRDRLRELAENPLDPLPVPANGNGPEPAQEGPDEVLGVPEVY